MDRSFIDESLKFLLPFFSFAHPILPPPIICATQENSLTRDITVSHLSNESYLEFCNFKEKSSICAQHFIQTRTGRYESTTVALLLQHSKQNTLKRKRGIRNKIRKEKKISKICLPATGSTMMLSSIDPKQPSTTHAPRSFGPLCSWYCVKISGGCV